MPSFPCCLFTVLLNLQGPPRVCQGTEMPLTSRDLLIVLLWHFTAFNSDSEQSQSTGSSSPEPSWASGFQGLFMVNGSFLMVHCFAHSIESIMTYPKKRNVQPI